MIIRSHSNRFLAQRLTAKLFSTAEATAFRANYEEFITNRQNKAKNSKVYTHPLQSEARPINISVAHLFHLNSRAQGPEQVSSHYETFYISRRFALGSIFAIVFFNYFARVSDLNWVLRTTMSTIPFYFVLGIYMFEIPKYMFLPMLNKFYFETFKNELKMMEEAFPEEVQDLVNKNMKEALEQFEYKFLHKKFKAVKEQSIERFLINQELDLKKNIQDRAESLLNQAKGYEEYNQREILTSILKKVQVEVEKLHQKPPQKVVDASFESALTGIREGKMTYKGDEVLALVMTKIKEEVGKFTSLKPEEFIQKIVEIA